MAAFELMTAERGVIVNTASFAAKDGQIGQADDRAAKAVIVGFTPPFTRELFSKGIRINTIPSGTFATPPMPLRRLLGTTKKIRGLLAASVPFPKWMGEPAEFASRALQTIAHGFFNGQTGRLDGAIRMSPR